MASNTLTDLDVLARIGWLLLGDFDFLRKKVRTGGRCDESSTTYDSWQREREGHQLVSEVISLVHHLDRDFSFRVIVTDHGKEPRFGLTTTQQAPLVMKPSLLVLLGTLVCLSTLITPSVAPFPPDDPRAVFNAFVMPWWLHVPRWFRQWMHLHFTGRPLPPEAPRRQLTQPRPRPRPALPRLRWPRLKWGNLAKKYNLRRALDQMLAAVRRRRRRNGIRHHH